MGRCRPAALPLRHTCLLLVFASCHRTVVVCGFECRKLCRGGEKKKKRLPALGWMSQRWRQSWSAVSYRGEKKKRFLLARLRLVGEQRWVGRAVPAAEALRGTAGLRAGAGREGQAQTAGCSLSNSRQLGGCDCRRKKPQEQNPK